ncbi:PEGA domain-containing protein [Bdellovibrionota bacterium FG-2]
MRLSRDLWLLFLIPGLAFAASRPEWLDHPPAQTKTDKYYIGRSSGAANDRVAVDEAVRDASDAAIRENFGFKTRINTQSYEQSDRAQVTKRIDERSRLVGLHDFEQVEFYREQSPDGRVNVWVLYRYPKVAIEREKARLTTVKEAEAPLVFTQQGNALDAVRGTIEVTSNPSASVYIDGERWGRTPLRLIGQLTTGEHIVRIEDTAYEAIEEKIIVVPGAKVAVNKILVPASGKIRVTTNLPNAHVVIDGKRIGTTPTDYVIVTAGKSIRIEVSHAEGEPLVTEKEILKDQEVDLPLVLTLKPALVAVTSSPSGAEIIIDERPLANLRTPMGFQQVPAGSHDIALRKNGYQDFNQHIELRGGEKLMLPTVRLVSLEQIRRQEREEEQERDAERARIEALGSLHAAYLFIGFGIGQGGKTVKESIGADFLRVSIDIEYKLKRRIGIKFGAGGTGGSNGSTSMTYNFYSYGAKQADVPVILTGSDYYAAVPFYLFESGNPSEQAIGWLFAGPTIGYAQHTYSAENIPDNSSTNSHGELERNGPGQTVTVAKFNQARMGGVVGYKLLSRNPSIHHCLTLQAGFDKYLNTAGFSGTTALSWWAGYLYRF